MKGKFLKGRPRPLPSPKIFVTKLTRDLFLLANLLVGIACKYICALAQLFSLCHALNATQCVDYYYLKK